MDFLEAVFVVEAIESTDEDEPILEDGFQDEFFDPPPVREARVLWDRTNPLVELNDLLFR
jgi:hypothetical protein